MQKTDILSVFSHVHKTHFALYSEGASEGWGEGEYPCEKVEDVVGLQS